MIEQFDDAVPCPMARAVEPNAFLDAIVIRRCVGHTAGFLTIAMGDDIHAVDGRTCASQAIVRRDVSSNDAEQALAVLVRTGYVRVLIDAATEFVHGCWV